MDIEHESDYSDMDLTDEYESDFSDMDLAENEVPKTKTKKRGLTRLPKLRTKFTNSGGKKHKVTFDELGKFSGEYRSEFPSFLGDLVREHVGFRYLAWKTVTPEVKEKLWEGITRFYDIDASSRRFVMNRLGQLLRNFRRKVFVGYILPNLGKPKMLAKIPRPYRSMVKQTDWDNFVTYTQSDEFKIISKKTKEARSKYVYDHHLGRGGYTYLREKLVQNNELAIDEIPSRALMWRKARQNENGEYKNANVKVMADKLINSETQIKDGALNLDPGTDALTVVFGKEKGGYLKGVGYGVTSSRYWQGPRTKGSSKERIAQLEFQLNNERLERGKKDEQIKTMSIQIAETNNTLNQVLAHLAAQGQVLPIGASSANKTSPTQVTYVDNNPGSKDNINATTSNASCKAMQTEVNSRSHISKIVQKEKLTMGIMKTRKKGILSMPETPLLKTTSTLESHEDVPQTFKCTLHTISLNNRVACGAIHYSTKNQTIHGVPLQDDCYRVSIDKVIKGAAFLPIETGEFKTVEDAVGSFVPWPKYLVKSDQKVPDPPSNKTQSTTTKFAKKQKKCFTTVDDLKKLQTKSKKKKTGLEVDF